MICTHENFWATTLLHIKCCQWPCLKGTKPHSDTFRVILYQNLMQSCAVSKKGQRRAMLKVLKRFRFCLDPLTQVDLNCYSPIESSLIGIRDTLQCINGAQAIPSEVWTVIRAGPYLQCKFHQSAVYRDACTFCTGSHHFPCTSCSCRRCKLEIIVLLKSTCTCLSTENIHVKFTRVWYTWTHWIILY